MIPGKTKNTERMKSRGLLIVTLLFLVLFVFWICLSLFYQAEGDQRENISLQLHLREEKKQLESDSHQSKIIFNFDAVTQKGYLKVNTAQRLLGLKKVADAFSMKLLYSEQEQPFLNEIIQITLYESVEVIFSELLRNKHYRIVKIHDPNSDPVDQFIICIGEVSCSEFRPQTSDQKQDSLASNEEAPPYVRELLDQDVSPDAATAVDFARLSAMLKEEFFRSGVKTKLELLQVLDVNLDTDFFIDVVVFEESAEVREAAASRLFPTNNKRALNVLMDALNDSNDSFVANLVGILSRSKDEEFRYQVGTLLSGHSSPIVQEALKIHNIPTITTPQLIIE